MHFTKTAVALAAVRLATAAPMAKRAPQVNEGIILNYALTLEHLENTFYKEALEKFDEADFKDAGFDSDFYNNIKKVSKDESDHVAFLTAGLTAAGATPVQACTYDFGYTDVPSFLATASILEGVGVSAYLGAAADIVSKAYLTAAGSILTVEARHSSYIRAGLKQAPFPQAFDAPLSYDEGYSLASLFIKSCPSSNPALPFKAFPSLVAQAGKDVVKAKSTITLLTPDYTVVPTQGGAIYAAFIAVMGPVFVETKAVDGGFEVVVPEGFAGQTYVVLTACNTGVTDDTVAAGPAIVEITA